jgi:hypothetical protein
MVLTTVCGTLRRNVVDILRGTYAIHRDLTIQAYLQPFVAVGIQRIRLARRGRSSSNRLRRFGSTSTEITARNRASLGIPSRQRCLSSGISRGRPVEAGRFNAMRDLGDAFGADATHRFIVKVSYWLG